MNLCVLEGTVQKQLKIQENNVDKWELHLKIEVENTHKKIWEEPKKTFILIKGICPKKLLENTNINHGSQVLVEGELRVYSIQHQQYQQKLWLVEIKKIFVLSTPKMLEITKTELKPQFLPQQNAEIRKTIVKSMSLAKDEIELPF